MMMTRACLLPIIGSFERHLAHMPCLVEQSIESLFRSLSRNSIPSCFVETTFHLDSLTSLC